jgi:hypothetical protein
MPEFFCFGFEAFLEYCTVLFFVADLKLPGMPEFFCRLEGPGILSFTLSESWLLGMPEFFCFGFEASCT